MGAMKLLVSLVVMVAANGQVTVLSAPGPVSRMQERRPEQATIGPSRNGTNLSVGYDALDRRLLSHGQAIYWIPRWHSRLYFFTAAACAIMVLSILILMFNPQQHVGQANMRLPPRWDPAMENQLSFRNWMQDLMLWTVVTDLSPPQQCAAIISQLGGAARELARTLSPGEVYHGGVVNGQHLDPVTFLLHGLSSRFAPLDEETRLRAAQDLLAFTRRQRETVDTVISRFEITRQRAQSEGGGAVSIETASLLLLRACGVSSEQFQTITQPLGFRLPTTDMEFHQMTHRIRRLGHIVERFPNNIASSLRAPQQQAHFSQAHQAYVAAEADTGSSLSGPTESWQAEGHIPAYPTDAWNPEVQDWAFAAVQGPGASDTESNTSSDHDEPIQTDDLQGLTPVQVDEYLFGQYQQAKRRWRRFTGKPVRALRRTLRRKGKGKGRGKGMRSSFLNIDDLLQQSSYFKGKGKGGKSSGKGFGRRLNPTGRDGDPLKCSICGSVYHLRARCNQRPGGKGTSGSSGSNDPPRQGAPAPTFTVETGAMHFATFEPSDASWQNVTTPRSMTSAAHAGGQGVPSTGVEAGFQVPGASMPCTGASSQAAGPQAQPSAPPTEHHMSPDPWTVNPDLWMEWYNSQVPESAQPMASQAMHGVEPQQQQQWFIPGIGNVGSNQSFSTAIGLTNEPPPALTALRPEPQAPSWCTNMQAAFGQIQASRAQASASSTESTFPRISEPPPVPEAFRRLGAIQSQQQRSAPAAFQVPPSAQLTGQVEVPPFSLPSPPVGHTLPATPAISGTELPSSVGVFAQVHALRSAHRRERRASDAQASSQTTSAGSPQPFRGHVASCTICLSEYTAGDQVCRLSCGHIFHALCIGEHCQHSAVFDDISDDMSLQCPNCRAGVTISRSWRVPGPTRTASGDTDPAAGSSYDPSTSQHHLASPEVTRPLDSEEEFLSPMDEQQHISGDAAYPWWPVPDVHASTSSEDQGKPSTESSAQAYHSSVKLSSGKVGLLVDPGSYGNLVGEQWLSNAAERLGQLPLLTPRAAALNVGGVGKGSQTCPCRWEPSHRLFYKSRSSGIRLSSIARLARTTGEQGTLRSREEPVAFHGRWRAYHHPSKRFRDVSIGKGPKRASFAPCRSLKHRPTRRGPPSIH